MSRRMIPQKDQDYIKVLSAALAADIAGNVEAHGDAFVDRNVEVHDSVEVYNNIMADNNVEVSGDLQVGGSVIYRHAVIPAYPTTAGTYVLKLTVDANGHATFAWIAA